MRTTSGQSVRGLPRSRRRRSPHPPPRGRLGREDEAEPRPGPAVVVREPHPDRRRDSRCGAGAGWVEPPAPALQGPARGSPPNRVGALPQAETPAPWGTAGIATSPVVVTASSRWVRGHHRSDRACACTGMLERVRERLLDDPVGGEVEAGGAADVAGQKELGLDAQQDRPHDEFIAGPQAGLRGAGPSPSVRRSPGERAASPRAPPRGPSRSSRTLPLRQRSSSRPSCRRGPPAR